jgi:uncharacterized coiled-coil protein SlyX
VFVLISFAAETELARQTAEAERLTAVIAEQRATIAAKGEQLDTAAGEYRRMTEREAAWRERAETRIAEAERDGIEKLERSTWILVFFFLCVCVYVCVQTVPTHNLEMITIYSQGCTCQGDRCARAGPRQARIRAARGDGAVRDGAANARRRDRAARLGAP